MKAIIDGLIYDTETATELFSATNNKGVPMFRWKASMFRTETGHYFVAGKGGALSMFSKSSPGGVVGSSAILPLSADGAYEVAEQYMPSEELIRHFPDRVQKA